MLKFPLICVMAVAFAAPALAQNVVQYRYDNFDTLDGVRFQTEQQRSVQPPAKTIRPTAKAVAPGNKASVRPAALLYTRASNMAMATSKSLDGYTTGSPSIDSLIVESGARNGVDPVLLYAIMHQESTFKARALSPKGARGLMQLMPGTAARFGVSNIFDPRQNIEGGARYVRFLLDTFNGDVSLALAGYNAGEGAVWKYGRIPPYSETQEYVRRIAGRYALMRDPETARNAHRVNGAQAVAVRDEHPLPLNVYERNVFAVRLPDGRLQLVSQ